jgi:7-cyano-7-deazaguanine synthase
MPLRALMWAPVRAHGDEWMAGLSIVAISGGMDSCVALALAASRGSVAGLHVRYGQRTEERELQAFGALCDHYGIERRLVVSIEYLKAIGGSSLTDGTKPIPRAEPRSAGVPSTYVPFRNAHILSVAVSWAEVIGAERVFIGAVEQDSSGYPDCRAEFFEAFGKAVETGTKPETKIEIVTPLIAMSKSDIVRKGTELGAPFQLTWSCYSPPVDGKACGQCESCRLRMRGFERAGVVDPVRYASAPDGL